jgi:hypothetical protein
MEAVRESWTDERLDDFRAETARRFDTLEHRMEEGFREQRNEMSARFQQVDIRLGGMDARLDGMDTRLDRMDARLDGMAARLDAMQRTMVYGFVAMSGAIVAGFGGMAGLIATQL